MTLLSKTTSTIAIVLCLTLSVPATESPKSDTITPPASLLTFTAQEDATGLVKEIYDEMKTAWGFVPVVLQQYSLNPKLLKAQWDLYAALGENKNFDPKMMTMMRMLVSDKHDCEYCVGLNKGMLLNMFKMPMDDIKALTLDPSTAKLDEKQKTMLLFMIKSANTPLETTASEITALQKLGWSDKDIFEGVKSAANMVSGAIVIDALKIQKDY